MTTTPTPPVTSEVIMKIEDSEFRKWFMKVYKILFPIAFVLTVGVLGFAVWTIVTLLNKLTC